MIAKKKNVDIKILKQKLKEILYVSKSEETFSCLVANLLGGSAVF